MARLPFRHKNKDHVKRPLIKVHFDVCGPVQTPTLCNENYFLTLMKLFQVIRKAIDHWKEVFYSRV